MQGTSSLRYSFLLPVPSEGLPYSPTSRLYSVDLYEVLKTSHFKKSMVSLINRL